MSDVNNLKNQLVGLTIVDVETSMTYSDQVFKLILKLSDGSELTLEPTTYNYGGQHLEINID